MNFDVRAYCERLAKAKPERFVLEGNHLKDVETVSTVRIRDGFNFDRIDWMYYNRELWAFIGPLAEELGIERASTSCSYTGRRKYDSLLEATFAAVCEKLEVAKP